MDEQNQKNIIQYSQNQNGQNDFIFHWKVTLIPLKLSTAKSVLL